MLESLAVVEQFNFLNVNKKAFNLKNMGTRKYANVKRGKAWSTDTIFPNVPYTIWALQHTTWFKCLEQFRNASNFKFGQSQVFSI